MAEVSDVSVGPERETLDDAPKNPPVRFASPWEEKQQELRDEIAAEKSRADASLKAQQRQVELSEAAQVERGAMLRLSEREVAALEDIAVSLRALVAVKGG